MNDTPCHLDIPMRNCDLFLDGEAVVRGGALVDGVGSVVHNREAPMVYVYAMREALG